MLPARIIAGHLRNSMLVFGLFSTIGLRRDARRRRNSNCVIARVCTATLMIVHRQLFIGGNFTPVFNDSNQCSVAAPSLSTLFHRACGAGAEWVDTVSGSQM